MIYVTHDQTEALTMSNRIAVFNDGKVHRMEVRKEARKVGRMEGRLVDQTVVLMDGSALGSLKERARVGASRGNVVSRSLGVGARVCRASRLRIGYSRRRRARRTVPLRWYAKRCGWHFPARTRVAVDARNECVRRSRRSRSRPQARSPRHRSLDSLGCERDGERIRSSARHGRRGRVGLRVDTRRGE